MSKVNFEQILELILIFTQENHEKVYTVMRAAILVILRGIL